MSYQDNKFITPSMRRFSEMYESTHMRRYKQDQPPMIQSQVSLKKSTSKILPPALVRNPESDFTKLPALNSSRRNSIASDRNAKFQVHTLDERLEEFAAEVHNTRLETQETIVRAKAIKEALANKEIERIREDLKKRTRGLERMIHSTAMTNQERFEVIRKDCGELWKQTEEIRAALFEARMRTERLEHRMGFR